MQDLFSKRNLIIAIIIILLLGGAAYWFFFLRNGDATDSNSGSGNGGFFSSLFPTSGGGNNPPPNTGNGDGNGDRISVETTATTGVEKIAIENVAGATFVKNKVRYVERGTGHVYEIDPDGKNKKRLSGTTIPSIFEVVWSGTGERAILKYLTGDNLNILSARFTASSTQGIFLAPEIKDVAFSPKGDRIAYVLPGAGGSQIIIASPENKNKRAVFQSPISSLRVYWPEEGFIYILNTPSAFLDGFLYRINLSTGGFEKITGPRLGLSVFGNAKTFLMSEAGADGTILSSVINLKTREIKFLSVKILPEKCAWSRKDTALAFCGLPLPFPQGNYPDDWYQGKVSFSDIFLKLNVSTEAAQTLSLGEVDISSPFLDSDEKTAFFINRRDNSLWKADLRTLASSSSAR